MWHKGTANTTQVAGEHYKAAYQHWDWVNALRLPYLPAQVTKYLTRWKKKNGLQDLEKARHFLSKLIEEAHVMRDLSDIATDRFITENKVAGRESLVIRLLARSDAANIFMLEEAMDNINKLIEDNNKQV